MQLRSAATFLFVASIVWIAIIVFSKAYYVMVIGMQMLGTEALIQFCISLLTGISFLLLGNSYRNRQYNPDARKRIGIMAAIVGGCWILFNVYDLVTEIVEGHFFGNDTIYYPWQIVLLVLPVTVLITGIALAGASPQRIRNAMIWMMVGALSWAAMIFVQLLYRLFFMGFSESPEMMLFDVLLLIKGAFPLAMFFWALAVRRRLGETPAILSESAMLDEL